MLQLPYEANQCTRILHLNFHQIRALVSKISQFPRFQGQVRKRAMIC